MIYLASPYAHMDAAVRLPDDPSAAGQQYRASLMASRGNNSIGRGTNSLSSVHSP